MASPTKTSPKESEKVNDSGNSMAAKNIKEASIVIEKGITDGRGFTEGVYWKVYSSGPIDEALLKEF